MTGRSDRNRFQPLHESPRGGLAQGSELLFSLFISVKLPIPKPLGGPRPKSLGLSQSSDASRNI